MVLPDLKNARISAIGLLVSACKLSHALYTRPLKPKISLAQISLLVPQPCFLALESALSSLDFFSFLFSCFLFSSSSQYFLLDLEYLSFAFSSLLYLYRNFCFISPLHQPHQVPLTFTTTPIFHFSPFFYSFFLSFVSPLH